MTHATRRTVLTGLGATGLTALTCAPARAEGLRYTAIALQTACDAVNQDTTREAARARMMASISRMHGQIAASRGFLQTFNGLPARLVVLPEYCLTGFPLGESAAAWRDKAALDPDGPEYDALAGIAETFDLFLAGNVYETDQNFPDLYFQTSFVIAPNGETVLRARRLISLFTATPYDVWNRYLDLYGYDAVFPVAKTEIGTLAAIASEEILYPEVARCLAMRGAEIFVHPTSEAGTPALSQKAVARRARAIENMAYVVSANSAEILGTPVPTASTDGMSAVIHPDGRVLAEAGPGETLVANAMLDLGALRAARQRGGMSNLLARQPFAAYAESYARFTHAEPNGFGDGASGPANRTTIMKRQQAVIDRLTADGVFR